MYVIKQKQEKKNINWRWASYQNLYLSFTNHTSMHICLDQLKLQQWCYLSKLVIFDSLQRNNNNNDNDKKNPHSITNKLYTKNKKYKARTSFFLECFLAHLGCPSPDCNPIPSVQVKNPVSPLLNSNFAQCPLLI